MEWAPGLVQGVGIEFMLCSNRMDQVVTLSSFEEEEANNSYLEYWLSRSPEERIEEVDRLRHEFAAVSNLSLDGFREGLSRSLLVVERGED
jgi:hypothetical protein